MPRELTAGEAIERSLIKRFRKELWKPFIVAVQRYELIHENDRVAVWLDGSTECFLMAKLLQELQRHSRFPFELIFLTKAEKGTQQDLCALLGLQPVYVEQSAAEVAVMMKCNRLALPCHMNDVIEVTLGAMLFTPPLRSVLPAEPAENGVTCIRPMYCIREEDIFAWSRYNSLSFTPSEPLQKEKREEIRSLLSAMKPENPDVETNVFNAAHQVTVDTIPGYQQSGEMHSCMGRVPTFECVEN